MCADVAGRVVVESVWHYVDVVSGGDDDDDGNEGSRGSNLVLGGSSLVVEARASGKRKSNHMAIGGGDRGRCRSSPPMQCLSYCEKQVDVEHGSGGLCETNLRIDKWMLKS